MSARYELKSIKQQDRVHDESTLPDVELVTPSRGQYHTSQDLPGSQPVDKYQLVFIILLIHGIGTLMPWNMFINAEDYFRNYKLQPAGNITMSNITSSNNNQNITTHLTRDRTETELESMRKNFLSLLSLAAQLPNTIFNGLNLLVNLGSGNLKLRVNLTLGFQAIIFAITILLAFVDSYQWPGTFFYVTMISVVLLNMASGVYQNCVFGIGAKFPGKYTNAILIGSNLSGTFTSVVNLLSIWLAPQPQEAAMYYFTAALFVIVICLVSYNLLHLNPFFRYYDQAENSDADPTECQLDIATTVRDDKDDTDVNYDIPETLRKTVDAMVPRPSNQNGTAKDYGNSFAGELDKKWQVFKKCWPQCMNVFFTFYFTLALFPSVMAGIQQKDNLLSNKYFAPVCCFLAFNLFALVGNLISGWTTWPGKDRVWMLVAVRVLFVPFFLFCNFNPSTRHWPVLIESDIIYTLGNVLMALTSGYLSSLCMMFASSGLSQDEAPKAGMLAAFFLVFGIFMGINSSFILTWAVEIG
uniref:Equilibrative nucleoside transporter 1 n=1 Tax=Aceria tosichella TaxID=561515 RepID=A0A6G1SIM5_9ACAR